MPLKGLNSYIFDFNFILFRSVQIGVNFFKQLISDQGSRFDSPAVLRHRIKNALFSLFPSPTVLCTVKFLLFVSVSLVSCLSLWQVSVYLFFNPHALIKAVFFCVLVAGCLKFVSLSLSVVLCCHVQVCSLCSGAERM